MPEADQRVPDDQPLVVDLDQSPEDGASAVAAKPRPVPGPSSSGLMDLEKQIEAERRERERITQDARRMQVERDQAIAYAQDAERRGATNWEQQVDNHIAQGQERMDALTAQQEAAYNDGDFKQVAEINRKLSHLGGEIAALERDKVNYLHQRERAAQQQPQRARQEVQQQPVDPLERAMQGRTETTKAFLRKHPTLIRGDGTFKKAAVDAHESALDQGLAVDTDGYFRHIEEKLKLGVSQASGNVEAPVSQDYGAAAPVSRGSGPGAGGNGTFVMTPKMRKLAEEQQVSPQEWAANYVRLLREGKITPIT
jgi:hypothetical protein